MADSLYPSASSRYYFGQYLSPEIYPWLGQGNTGQDNRSAFSPLLFPPERPITSPIVPQEELTPQTFGGGVVLDTEPYVSDSDKTRQAIEQRIADAPMAMEPYVSKRDRRIQAIDERIANSPIPIQPYVSRKMADTQTNSNSLDNLGSLLFGGGGDGMEDYLTPKQQKAIQNQAMMQAAASLLKSSGRTTQPISIGQALGEAYGAGTAGYQQAQQGAIQQLLMRQKLDEYKRQMADEQAYKDMFTQISNAGEPMTAMQAAALPDATYGQGPSPQKAAMIGMPTQANATTGGMPVLTQVQRDILRRMPAKEGRAELLKMVQPEEFGVPQPQVVDGQIQMVQYDKKGNRRVVPGVMPYEAQSPDIRAVEYITGQPLAGRGQSGISEVGQYRQQIAPKTTVTVPVDMTGGQKGFENEMSLGKAFRAEPIYKDFSDMKTAYSQVVSSLAQGTPIGDVAGATKVMKLLDPGSVVRESELGIAMAASGRMDRLQYYFNNFISGEKLTPTQRDDFRQLSAEIYAAAGQAYNQKRDEYKGFGGQYGFKNLDAALGAPATLPSLVKKPADGAITGTPLDIQDILNKYPARKQ
jgi:hypothetical protein